MAMKVSVVIPALNAAAFVGGAIRSVLAQTLSDLEVVVVDDGSTDATAAIVQGFMGEDARVRLIRHETPRGVSAARNTAIGVATGDWIALLDADDAFTPARLERLVAEAERRGLDGLADNLQVVDYATGAPLGLAFPDDWMTTGEPLTLDMLLDRDTPGNHDFRPLGLIKPILRRDRLQSLGFGFAEDIAFAEDFLLYAQLLLSGFRLGLTGAALYVYAVRPNSASNRSTLHQRRDAADYLEVNRRIIDFHDGASNPIANDLRSKLRRREQAIRYWRFVTLAKDGHILAAVNAARRIRPCYLITRLLGALRRRGLQARTSFSPLARNKSGQDGRRGAP
jgi:succinoglycan biosynthesis protein ExoO